MSLRDFTVLGSSSQVPTRNRNHNGYLMRWDGEGFLFDPGEGTQRQFIFAQIAPTVVNRIFLTHFHGDHCLGLPGMLQRLSLDQIPHKLHIYYPESGHQFLENMRSVSVFHDRLDIEYHPVSGDGLIEETDNYTIYARALVHPVDTYGYRFEEKVRIKFVKEKLQKFGLKGSAIGKLQNEGSITTDNGIIKLEDVTVKKEGFIFAFVLDTEPCKNAELLAENADFLITEGTFLQEQAAKASEYGHMTVRSACRMAEKMNVGTLMLTHFSQRYQNISPIMEEAETNFKKVILAKDLLNISLRSLKKES
jgi:ribonuclease Z